MITPNNNNENASGMRDVSKEIIDTKNELIGILKDNFNTLREICNSQKEHIERLEREKKERALLGYFIWN
jgi:hypothetical protein